MTTSNELVRVEEPSNGLALPAGPPHGLALPPAFGFTALPPEEPSALWKATVRHFKLLLVCALLSLGAAAYAGMRFGKPLWLAEGMLLFQPVTLTDAQAKIYIQPPYLNTMSNWATERAVIDKLLAEVSPATAADDYLAKLKVVQPDRTQAIYWTLTWPDRDEAVKLVGRHMELLSAYAIDTRKETVLRLALSAVRQERSEAQSKVRFWDEQIRDMQARLKGGAVLADPDPSMVSVRSTLEDRLRQERGHLREHEAALGPKLEELKLARRLDAQQAVAHIALLLAESEVKRVRIQIEQAEKQVQALTETLDALPIKHAEGQRSSYQTRLRMVDDDLRQLDELSRQPSPPPARGFLQGMDAAELIVKAEAHAGDKPAATSKKQIAAITFMLLMAAAFALLLAYDRVAHPPARPAAPPPSDAPTGMRTSVVKVSRRGTTTEEVTIARVDSERLGVRIDHWLKGSETNGSNGSAPLTLGQDGQVVDPPPGGGDDPAHLAMRIQQWLEKY